MVNVSQKELYSIENRLESEKMLVEKYLSYAEEYKGTPLADKFRSISDVHKKHFNILLGYLR